VKRLQFHLQDKGTARFLIDAGLFCAYGQEMIAMGKGLGFGTLPREISLGEIERSFYDVTPRYVEVTNYK
jgi:hypothetical protein